MHKPGRNLVIAHKPLLPSHVKAPNVHVRLGTEYAERTQQPENHDDDHHHVQDFLDFPVHGDVRINKP
jgi:hypothetical protein